MLTLKGESSFSERGTELKSLKGRSDKGAEGTIPSWGETAEGWRGDGVPFYIHSTLSYPFFVFLLLTA